MGQFSERWFHDCSETVACGKSELPGDQCQAGTKRQEFGLSLFPADGRRAAKFTGVRVRRLQGPGSRESQDLCVHACEWRRQVSRGAELLDRRDYVQTSRRNQGEPVGNLKPGKDRRARRYPQSERLGNESL